MSESGDELSSDLTGTPESSHQAPDKKRRSRRVRTPNGPFSPSTKKGAKTKSKSKENLTKLVTGKVRATRKQEGWVIPPMRDNRLGLTMKLLSQNQAAQWDEEEQETRQQQGEEEALSRVKVEGGEEIALIESVIEDDEEPLTVAFRRRSFS